MHSVTGICSAAPSDQAAADRVLDDERRGSVFDGAAGVGPFSFAEDLDAGKMLRQLVQADERGVADAFEQGGAQRGGLGGGGHRFI
jgi:hypothetical protein